MSPSRFLLGSALGALGTAAVLLSPSEARAEQYSAFSPGLHLSLTFGEKLYFGLGLDARYSLLLQGTPGCLYSVDRAGIGAFAQATWLNFSAGRVALGLHGGTEYARGMAGIDAEVGWTYRSALSDAIPAAHGVQAGLNFGAPPWSILELALRGTIPWPGSKAKPEFTIAAGARIPTMFGEPTACIAGRLLRFQGECVLPGVWEYQADDPRQDLAHGRQLDEATRMALAQMWLDDTRAECASIPAFFALARDLAALGAPIALVRKALAAADDEVRHTELCASMAGDFSSMTFTPELLPAPPPSALNRKDEIIRLCLESWQDGCLGEGIAAERAKRQAQHTADPTTASALATIAKDEAHHAALGWGIVEWCLSAGGSSVRDALGDLRGFSPNEPVSIRSSNIDPQVWRALGGIEQTDLEGAWETTTASTHERLERLLVVI